MKYNIVFRRPDLSAAAAAYYDNIRVGFTNKKNIYDQYKILWVILYNGIRYTVYGYNR